jgi:hypothetical protein
VLVPPPPAPKPQPATPATVELFFKSQSRSQPLEGAEIFDGPRRLGMTPERVRLPRSDKPLTLTFRLEGYEDTYYPVVPLTEGEEVTIELKPLPRARHHHRAAKKPAAGSRDMPPVTAFPSK